MSNRQNRTHRKVAEKKTFGRLADKRKGVPDVILRSSRGMKGGFLDGVAHHSTENGRRLCNES